MNAEVSEAADAMPFGEARVVREEGVTIVAVSTTVHHTLTAAEVPAKDGVVRPGTVIGGSDEQ